ncbi:MAG: SGNH/GDSL hydrolase family protein [Planctomycetota bacterium]
MPDLIKPVNDAINKWRNAAYKLQKSFRLGDKSAVCEGDSWFQHPLESDIIEELIFPNNSYRIYSLAGAGDELADMLGKGEFVPAIKQEKPDIFLFSGGGNDVIAKRLRGMVCKPSTPSSDPRAYVVPAQIDGEMAWLATQVTQVYRQAQSAKRNLPMFMHGYDYAVPGKKYRFLGLEWNLGDTLDEVGVPKARQYAVVQILIDRFNETLVQLATTLQHFHYVDLRGTLQKKDFVDELHPSSEAAAWLAAKMHRAIRKVV